MDILLVNPYSISMDRNERRFRRYLMPLGPLYVASYLRERGFSVSYYDAAFKDRPFDPFKGPTPEWVGFYTTFIARENTFELIRKAKAIGARTMVGGPDASMDPMLYLREGTDIAVIGEGEITTEEVLRSDGPDGKDIPGTAYLKDGLLHRAPPRALIDDPDSMPPPARDLAPMHDYTGMWKRYHGMSVINIISSRGCPYGCKWCSKPVFGTTYRQRSVDSVVSEVRSIRKTYSPDRLWFSDDVLPMRRDWVMEFSEAMAGEEVEFECLSRVDLLDVEIAKALRKAGCRKVHLGVESGSQHVLDAMQKGTKIPQITKASKALKDAGIEQNWFLMYGYPGERTADILDTMRLTQDLLPESYGISIAYPLPGTEFYDEVADRITGSDWDRTLQNKLVFEREYSQTYYDAARLWTHGVVRTARLMRGKPLDGAWDKFTMFSAKVVLSLMGGS